MNHSAMSVDEIEKAIQKGDLQAFVSLINRKKLDVNYTNFPHGMPALHLACAEGQREIVQWLLDQPQTDLEKEDKIGFRAVHHAALGWKCEILEILIKKGAQLDCRISTIADGDTPLLLVLSALYSQSSFSAASTFRLLECCRLLMQSGCDVNIQKGSTKDTPLHYAIMRIAPDCLEVIKLLVAKLMREQADRPDHLKKLIDVKRCDGMNALLMACHRKNYVAIELIVMAGADTKAVDDEGITALMRIASSVSKDSIPTKELSPYLFEFYQRPSKKKMFESHPILLILAYLIEKGCCWEATNKAGKRASDILLEKGHPQFIIDFLDQAAAKNHPEPEEIYHKKVSPIYAFYWINGPEMGSVEDHLGNKFAWDQQLREDGSVGYRCCHKMMGADKDERCPAVAIRFFQTPNRVPLILLQEPHSHKSGMKRNSDGGTYSGEEGTGPSGAKRSCADGAA